MSTVCRSCDAPIIWAVTTTGKRMPLDAEPTANGNLVLIDGVARQPQLGDVFTDLPTYTSHFATCPNANDWRKKK